MHRLMVTQTPGDMKQVTVGFLLLGWNDRNVQRWILQPFHVKWILGL